MNQVQVSQMVPWPGTLGAARQQQESLADAVRYTADETAVQLISRVRSVYYQIAFIDRAITIAERTRSLLRDFLDVALARYGVGDGLQQDVFQAQVNVAEQTAAIARWTRERVATAARLNALLGRSAGTPVGGLELPDRGSASRSGLPAGTGPLPGGPPCRPPRLASLRRTRGIQPLEADAWPDLMFSAAYGERPQFGDMVTLMVGVSVPLRAGSRQRPKQAEMAAMRESESAEARRPPPRDREPARRAACRGRSARAVSPLRHGDPAPGSRQCGIGALRVPRRARRLSDAGAERNDCQPLRDRTGPAQRPVPAGACRHRRPHGAARRVPMTRMYLFLSVSSDWASAAAPARRRRRIRWPT